MKKVLVLLVSMFLVTSSAYAKMCPKLWAQFELNNSVTFKAGISFARFAILSNHNKLKL